MTETTFLNENANESLQNEEVTETATENAIVKEAASFEENANQNEEKAIDYEALILEDVKALKNEFYELSGLSDITELENPLRYAELRDLGLSPAEAYLATKKRRDDNRSHLRAIHNVKSTHQNTMSDSELASCRELFGNISDAEIRRLYKRVTK